jgi:thiazole/oxazole-forming peptide maturase SagD family component
MFGQTLTPWYASRYTGLFARSGPIPLRPHYPAVCVWAGTLPQWGVERRDLATGGAAWDAAGAEAAGVGEAVERCVPQPLAQDEIIAASFAAWQHDEPAVGPDQWVQFHAEQYGQPGFPFAPWTSDAIRRWVCCRAAGSGEPAWVPEEYVFLAPRSGSEHRFGPALSTGLSCGRRADPVVLRGLQEVIERDALVGAWWGSYALEEHDPERVFRCLEADKPVRLQRPNLRYRFYRVRTPSSAHVAIVTLTGEDQEGCCFSVGSACRETRAASWQKAVLEAVQGRHYVRFLRALQPEPVTLPTDFAGHAVYYSYHPEELARTVLERATGSSNGGDEAAVEGLPQLLERLGPSRPVFFRHLTPPALLAHKLDYLVCRVLVPGLQPLHGHHLMPYLGGPLWAPRGLRDYEKLTPHPFP